MAAHHAELDAAARPMAPPLNRRRFVIIIIIMDLPFPTFPTCSHTSPYAETWAAPCCYRNAPNNMRVTDLAEDQLTYPRRHGSSPKSNDLTSKLSFVALNGWSSREIGFDIDPRTAVS